MSYELFNSFDYEETVVNFVFVFGFGSMKNRDRVCVRFARRDS